MGYNNNKSCGVVLQVDSIGAGGQDFIKLVNEVGEVKNIKSAEITKKFDLREQMHQAQAIDS